MSARLFWFRGWQIGRRLRGGRDENVPAGEDEVRVGQATAVGLGERAGGLEDPGPGVGIVEVLLGDLAQRVPLDHGVAGVIVIVRCRGLLAVGLRARGQGEHPARLEELCLTRRSSWLSLRISG